MRTSLRNYLNYLIYSYSNTFGGGGGAGKWEACEDNFRNYLDYLYSDPTWDLGGGGGATAEIIKHLKLFELDSRIWGEKRKI